MGAVLGAAALGGIANLGGAWLQNVGSAQQAQKQMDFQERMSDTAYQRATADMRKAGLNPALAYQQGGASSPGGSAAPVQNVGSAATSGAAQGASSAAAVQANQANIAQTQAQTRLTNANAATALVESEYKSRMYEAQLRSLGANSALTEQNTRFGEDTYDDRKGIIYAQGLGAKLDNQQKIFQTTEANPIVLEQMRAELARTGASAAQIRANTESLRQGMNLRSLEFPEARAMSDFWSSPWGRRVGPYLPSAHSALDLFEKFGAAAGGF